MHPFCSLISSQCVGGTQVSHVALFPTDNCCSRIKELGSSIVPPASINSLSIYYDPTGWSSWLKLIVKPGFPDSMGSRGFWQWPIHSWLLFITKPFQRSNKIHHPPFPLCLVCCNNPSLPNVLLPLPYVACTHKLSHSLSFTHTSLFSYNSTEQTLSHFRNCYFGAGLFLLSAVSH